MKRFIPSDQLILNSDQSIYHLGLKKEEISDVIITVGDPERVAMVSSKFDHIEHRISNREFHTHTGIFQNKRLSVISTGIGTDNIDIVLNELDALVNIDFANRQIINPHSALTFIRIGTSGALQMNVPVDSTTVSAYAIGMDNLMQFYETDGFIDPILTKEFNLAHHLPFSIYAFPSDQNLLSVAPSAYLRGITMTNPGFYGPQGRTLRLASKFNFDQIRNFESHGLRITNLEMETSGIYGLAKLLGHRAISFNAILANRISNQFSKHPVQTIDNLISEVLEWIITYV